MGISGLLPLLKEAQEEIHISKYKGKVVGVDAYVWLHRGAYGCAQQLSLGQPTTSYVNFAMRKVNMLRYHGVTPLIVFDGGHLPAKAKTEEERERRRRENLGQAKTLLAQGRTQQAREYFVKCVDVTPAMAFQLIKALRGAGIDYIVAPYEADAQLAYLERRGTIEGIITEDSDLLVFGCKAVLYKLDDEGRCIEVLHENRSRCKKLALSTFTDASFRQMAILSGCDYLASIPGMGLKTAHRLLRQCGSVARALSAARMDGMKVPATYQHDFEKAEKTFVYQRVFHRSASSGNIRMVTLTPCNGQADIEDEDCIGPMLPDAVVGAIASGDVDPITRLPIVDLNPSPPQRSHSTPTQPSSFYAGTKPKLAREVPLGRQKTLDGFFARAQTVHDTEKAGRKALGVVTNVTSSFAASSTHTAVATPKQDETGGAEKSKYFACSPVEECNVAQLASFTPTNAKRRFSRCLSTDSGEISSPASSARKHSRNQLQSSPLVGEEDADRSSPTTSPTISRPRKSVQDLALPLLVTHDETEEAESDIDEDEKGSTLGLGFLHQFAYQQTPVPQQHLPSVASRGSNSSAKKRPAALLFHEEEADLFSETPLLKRSQSAFSTLGSARPPPMRTHTSRK